MIRSRLSDISWWLRNLFHHIAMPGNHEDQEVGRFFQSRLRAVRLLDEQGGKETVDIRHFISSFGKAARTRHDDRLKQGKLRSDYYHFAEILPS